MSESLFGVGLRSAHYEDLLAAKPHGLDWLEVISENYMATGGLARRVVTTLASVYPMAMHGVGLCLGGLEPVSDSYLKALKELFQLLRPRYVSDHLAFTSHQGFHSHDLLPFPLTEENFRRVALKISMVQDELDSRILIENPSVYVKFQHEDMTEPQFLNRLCEQTGCGLLVDLNNLEVNFKNGGLNPYTYLSELNAEDVCQFHLAGHDPRGAVIVDTHSAAVSDYTLTLFAHARALFRRADTILEWDDQLPSFAGLLAELDRARAVSPCLQRIDGAPPAPLRAAPCEAWDHEAFVSSIRDQDGRLPAGIAAESYEGFLVYYRGFRARVFDILHSGFPMLYEVMGEASFAQLAREYALWASFSHYSADFVGEQVSAFIATRPACLEDEPVEIYQDLASFEWALHEVVLLPARTQGGLVSKEALVRLTPEQWDHQVFSLTEPLKVLDLTYDVLSSYSLWQKGSDLPLPEPGRLWAGVWRQEERAYFEKLSAQKAFLLQSLESGSTLPQMVGEMELEEVIWYLGELAQGQLLCFGPEGRLGR